MSRVSPLRKIGDADLWISDAAETAAPSSPNVYAEVALGVPQEEPFQYAVPVELQDKIAIGKRVKVPLKFQTRYGYVVGFSAKPAYGSVKPLLEVVDEEPLIDEVFLKLTRWISDYYFCSWGQAIEAAMPAPFKKGKTTMRSRAPKGGEKTRDWIHATPHDHVLTADQDSVYQKVKSSLNAREYQSFLLHGVTGSGKTEVYLRLIQDLIAQGRSAIVLVPEISLTPQTTDRFESRFAGLVAVIHSRLSAGKRLQAWHRIRKGEAKVVVGPRSAVFSPVRDLALIIIDEEHDDSYKQDETPRYDACFVAEKRCRLENAVLLKGSATPRLESFFAAHAAREVLALPNRIEDRPLPAVQVIDMRHESHGRFTRVFSLPLEAAVKDALAAKEQVMLFLNRRGFSPFVSCLTCGYVSTCPRCRVSLVFHFERQTLLCHTCSHTSQPPKICPGCNKGYLRYLGMGTEKVESEAARLFPGARIARMDTDTTSRAGSHEKILSAFRKKEIDILLGTQMITKGHDFPGVTLIGVISADTALHLPDFRSAERTFSVLTQVAGRAGREAAAGRVFVQTFVPFHYAIIAAKDHDYAEFYQKEIVFREELGMPPFRHLIQVLIAGRDEKIVVKRSLELRNHTEEAAAKAGIDVLGPAPCIVSKRRNLFLWNLYYKAEDAVMMNKFLRERLENFSRQGVMVTVDVDPR